MDDSGSGVGEFFDGLVTYLSRQWDSLLQDAWDHALVVAVSIVIATVLGVLAGLAVYRSRTGSALTIAVAAAIITIPSFALLSLLIAPLGLGWAPTVVALVAYSMLPILRNTVVGLRELPGGVEESAIAMGMSPRAVLWRVKIPLAWPVIITGMRVSTQVIMGIAAIAAFVGGPGLGSVIFSGLSRLGGANALNQALVGTIGIVIIAFAFDALFVLVRNLTTSRGLRV